MASVAQPHLGLVPTPLGPPTRAPQVGEQTRHWEEGRVLVCHTSFMHETANNTDRERVVLIMRHFHPEVRPRPGT